MVFQRAKGKTPNRNKLKKSLNQVPCKLKEESLGWALFFRGCSHKPVGGLGKGRTPEKQHRDRAEWKWDWGEYWRALTQNGQIQWCLSENWPLAEFTNNEERPVGGYQRAPKLKCRMREWLGGVSKGKEKQKSTAGSKGPGERGKNIRKVIGYEGGMGASFQKYRTIRKTVLPKK